MRLGETVRGLTRWLQDLTGHDEDFRLCSKFDEELLDRLEGFVQDNVMILFMFQKDLLAIDG